MFAGYNSNGFAHHRLEDIVSILGDLGYRGMALTLDYHHLDPFAKTWTADAKKIAKLMARYHFRCVIETGSRFLLDPRHKHQPTLISSDPNGRKIRYEFLERAILIAQIMEADAVSFWSGSQEDPGIPWLTSFGYLVENCQKLSEFAQSCGIRLAFEPEPGMLIERMEQFAYLHNQVLHPSFGLTLDIGHLQCLREWPFHPFFHQWKDYLWNIHLEDMKAGIHEHLPLGQGELDFYDIFHHLREVNYEGGLYLELSRESHRAVQSAIQSKAFLQQFDQNFFVST